MAEVINGTSDQDLETLKERFAREYLDLLQKKIQQGKFRLAPLLTQTPDRLARDCSGCITSCVDCVTSCNGACIVST
jgi:hypothetical protein